MRSPIIDPVMTLSDITATKTLRGHRVGGQDSEDNITPHQSCQDRKQMDQIRKDTGPKQN